ncbi:MAG: ABC transporter ATP-binding protein [Chloroflexota bacterium]
MSWGREGFERAAQLDKESAANRRAVLARMSRYAIPHMRQIVYALLAMIGSAIALSLGPIIVGYAIDNHILKGDFGALMWDLALLLIVYSIQYLSFRGQFYFGGTVGQSIMADLRDEVFRKAQKLSLSYFDKNDAGDLMSRLVNDVDTLNQFLSQGAIQFFGGIVRMLIIAIAMVVLDWRLALAVLIVVPMMILTSNFLSRMARSAFRKSRESLGDVSTELEEGISGVKVAQAFNRGEANAERFADLNRRNRDANVLAMGISAAFQPAMEALNALATAIVAGLGGFMVLSGVITVGLLVSFLEFVRGFFFPVQQIAQLWVLLQSSLAGAERIFNLLDEPITLSDTDDAQLMPPIDGQIEFQDVHFSYDPDEPILKGISFVATPGQTVAIVGPTGAGKTTIINLVTRFYDIDSGTVAIDGVDVRSVTQDSLRSQIGVVLQDNFLFSGTVAENIRYGRPDATDEEVEAAAKTVGAHNFIMGLSDGYRSELGERGGTLSQGQRQLISFARAILADPRILILDEATASVDTRTELVIQEALQKLLHGRTSIVIAHRLSTIRDADLVLVLEDGHIIERGNHEELISLNGAYAQLYSRQFRSINLPSVNGHHINGATHSSTMAQETAT